MPNIDTSYGLLQSDVKRFQKMKVGERNRIFNFNEGIRFPRRNGYPFPGFEFRNNVEKINGNLAIKNARFNQMPKKNRIIDSMKNLFEKTEIIKNAMPEDYAKQIAKFMQFMH